MTKVYWTAAGNELFFIWPSGETAAWSKVDGHGSFDLGYLEELPEIDRKQADKLLLYYLSSYPTCDERYIYLRPEAFIKTAERKHG